MEIWDISSLGVLWILLYKHFCGSLSVNTFLLLLGKYPGMGLLDGFLSVCLTWQETVKWFSKFAASSGIPTIYIGEFKFLYIIAMLDFINLAAYFGAEGI